jgi:hypothetical protein
MCDSSTTGEGNEESCLMTVQQASCYELQKLPVGSTHGANVDV